MATEVTIEQLDAVYDSLNAVSRSIYDMENKFRWLEQRVDGIIPTTLNVTQRDFPTKTVMGIVLGVGLFVGAEVALRAVKATVEKDLSESRKRREERKSNITVNEN